MFENMFERKEKVDNGLFPIKKVGKDAIVPINVKSSKWYDKC